MSKTNNSVLQRHEQCFGCGACVNVCPKNAIKLQEDENGFWYPNVSAEACVNCGICIKTCAAGNNSCNESQKIAYAAVSKRESVKQSSSGGVFSALAEEMLKNGGMVAGCVENDQNDETEIYHTLIDKEADLFLMQGSKYVQSETTEIFPNVKKTLESGRKVLFSGTPCQVAELRNYIGQENPNLYTIDLICHGVPSQKMYRDYLHYIGSKRRHKVVNFVFRDKRQGFGLNGYMILEKGANSKEVRFKPEQSSYYELFLEGKTYRNSCYHCPFACTRRTGDITIGDFWGFESTDGLRDRVEEFKKKGISLVIVNNDRGSELLSLYGVNIEFIDAEFNEAAKHNPRLLTATKCPSDHEKVMSLYRQGYSRLDKWYQKRHLYWTVRIAIASRIPVRLKKVLGR